MKMFMCCALLFLAAMTLSAAGIDGKWAGTFVLPGPNGDSQTGTGFVILHRNGAELTGSGGPDEARQWPLQKGHAEGNRVTFEVQDPDGALYRLDCTLADGHLKGVLTVVNPGAPDAKGTIDLAPVAP